jgi:hypothetical protein
MAIFARIYSRVVPQMVRSEISSLVGKLSGANIKIKDMQAALTQMEFEVSNLRLELESSKDIAFATLNSRENRIHEFVKSALNIVARNLDNVILVTDEASDCELGKIFDLLGSDKNSRHSYAQIYENLLSKKTAPRILEIGIGSLNSFPYAGIKPGCSLDAWRKRYPASFIVGADIDPASVNEVSEIAYLVDQTDSSSLDALSRNLKEYGLFDLIVDDGFHDPHANIQTLIQMLPHLSNDGSYIIEDVHASLIDFWQVVIAVLELDGEILDMSPLRPQTDDNVLIVIKLK